ncbi:DNA primase [Thermopirellula anaerolimosa]
MPGMYSAEIKERVRQAVDIVDLVERYLPLRRQGRGFAALCPWHDDHRPSLQVNPERQVFRCFVCNIGGDVFSFVMKMEGVEFPEALEMLAEMAGISLPRADRDAQGSSGEQKTDLFRVMAWAEEQYHRCLLDAPEAETARKYFQERRISRDSVLRFRLGYSPPRPDWLLRLARRDGIDPSVLAKVGILLQSTGREWFDRFRGRVLFAIHDPQGRSVGLGGRVLPDGATTSPAKYINSPDTPLFNKSRLLYGLDLAREAIRKTGTVLIMEGYTDVIAAHQFGFANAVAVLGTALGDSHLRLLQRYADRVVLVLDGDAAGRRRAAQVLELFVARQIDMRVLTLPDNLDPCDFLHERGPDAFAHALEHRATDALEHAVAEATRGVDLERDVAGATRAAENVLAVIAKAPLLAGETNAQQQAREWKIVARLAAMTRIHEDLLRRRLEEMRTAKDRRAARSPTAVAAEKEGTLDAWERTCLEVMVSSPQAAQRVFETFTASDFRSEAARSVFETAREMQFSGIPPSWDKLLLAIDDPERKNLIIELDEGARRKLIAGQNVEDLIRDLLKSFHEREAFRRRGDLQGVLRQGGLQPDKELELLMRIVEQERNRQKFTEPTEG